jgi:hypothetical protein
VGAFPAKRAHAIDGHPKNAPESIAVTLAGIITEGRAVQPLNAFVGIVVCPASVIDVREAQFMNAQAHDVTVGGTIIEVNPEPPNALYSIVVTLLGIVTEVKDVHEPNAHAGITV